MFFLTLQVPKIQGRQACLRRHHNDEDASQATVSLPEGVNESQFRVYSGKGVNDFLLSRKETRGKPHKPFNDVLFHPSGGPLTKLRTPVGTYPVSYRANIASQNFLQFLFWPSLTASSNCRY